MLLSRNNSALVLVDVQEKLLRHIENANAMHERCAWLLTLAKEMDVPVTISEQYPQGLGKTDNILQAIHPSIDPITKVSFSCGRTSAFQAALTAQRRRQIILTGIETHVCVLQTAMDLLQKNYEIYIVTDATGTRASMDKKYALKRMAQAGAQLVTSEMVFFEWLEEAGTSEFKHFSKKYLQSKDWSEQ